MIESTKLAIEKKLSRKVLQISLDKATSERRVQVLVSDGTREEMDYYYITEGLEGQAVQLAKALATKAFLGVYDIQEVPSSVEEAQTEEAPVVDKPAATVTKKKAVKKSPAKRKVKSEPYDRTNDDHKKEFGDILESAIPGWGVEVANNTDLRAAIGGLSQKLNGEPFIGGDKKEVLQSFIDAVLDTLSPFMGQKESSAIL